VPLAVPGPDRRPQRRSVPPRPLGSLETGEINRAPDPCPVEDATPERLFTALVRFAIDKEAAGYRPGWCRCARRRSPRRGGSRWPAWASRSSWCRGSRRTARAGAAPERDAPGLRPGRQRPGAGERARRHDRAAAFVRGRGAGVPSGAPWERLDGDQDRSASSRRAGPGAGVVTVMGSLGQEFGLGCFASLEQFLGVLRAQDDETIDRAMRRRSAGR